MDTPEDEWIAEICMIDLVIYWLNYILYRLIPYSIECIKIIAVTEVSVKLLSSEVDHSSPSIANIKMVLNCIFTPVFLMA